MSALSFVGKSKNPNESTFRAIALISLFLAVALLQGCEQISYYGQAVQGHIEIMASQEPIDELIEDPSTDPKLKQRLSEVLTALEFAEQTLVIPQAETNYRKYVQLDRPYPVWSVVAAPNDSLTPRQWCYPFVGCASYRGYYSEEAAKNYAQGIHDEGDMDVHVGGADAYSTLGWFNDPVLSTFFRRDKIGLHALIFHELAHQVLYLQGDSTFNESFASAVEETGIELWLDGQPELLQTFQARKQRSQDFRALLQDTQQTLKEIYQQDLPKAQKLSLKEEALNQLTDNYQTLKATKWNGYNGYDHWFNQPVNNARLALVSTYNHWVPAFKQWIRACEYDFPRFYDAVSTLSEQSKTERERVLTMYDDAATSHQTATPTISGITGAPSLPCRYSPNS